MIGGSAGGYAAIRDVMKDLSVDIPAAVILLLHRAKSRTFDLPASLGHAGNLPVIEVTEGMALREGAIFVVPPRKSVALRDDAIFLEDLDAPQYPRESINRLFTSAATVFQERVIGVVLTGMLRDGTDGLRAIAQAGGVTIVQADAKHPGMPTSARQDWPVTFCLNLTDIGETLDLLSRRKGQLESGVAVSARLLRRRLALFGRLLEQSKDNASTTRFLSEELGLLRDDLRSLQTLLPRLLG